MADVQPNNFPDLNVISLDTELYTILANTGYKMEVGDVRAYIIAQLSQAQPTPQTIPTFPLEAVTNRTFWGKPVYTTIVESGNLLDIQNNQSGGTFWDLDMDTLIDAVAVVYDTDGVNEGQFAPYTFYDDTLVATEKLIPVFNVSGFLYLDLSNYANIVPNERVRILAKYTKA